MAWFRRYYLSIDPRTLGLARILFGSVLLLDLAKRSCELQTWYTNAGLLPNHTMLWRPIHQWHLSFFYTLSQEHEAILGFVFCALVYLAFLVGWRTRLFHILSLVCLHSLQARVEPLSNGGDYVFCTMLLWTAFLPMGRCFSVDAVHRRRIAAHAGAATSPVVSLAVFAILLQLAAIYFFNAVSKNGETWLEGSAIHYVLHQDRIVTALGASLRDGLPFWVSQWLSHGAIAIEGAAAVLIVSPWGRAWTRITAVALLWSLHGGIALLVNVGVFSPVMMSSVALLLTERDWERFDRLAARHAPATRARWSSRWRAIGGALANRLPPSSALRRDATRTDDALAGAADLWRRTVATVAIVFLMITSAVQALHENDVLPAAMRIYEVPGWARMTVSYMRIRQGWRMFAPDAPRGDAHIVVDAITSDGRRVDPFNEVASRSANPWETRIPRRLGQSVFFCDYAARIAAMEFYHTAFREWIFAYHERTGRPEDRIVAFQAFTLEDASPPPGDSLSTPPTRRRFLYASR